MYLFHPGSKTPLSESLAKPGAGGPARPIKSRPVAQARLLVDVAATTIPAARSDTHVSFDISLKKGQQVTLEGQFLDKEGNVLCGAFYTFLQKKDPKGNVPSLIEYVSAAQSVAAH